MNDIATIEVEPEWLVIEMQPLGRETLEATGVHPWATYYQCHRDQSMIDYQLMSFARATRRILTCPFENLDSLPLLINGRLQLATAPWEPPKKRTTRTRKAVAK